jgi:hypothetical protein
MTRNIDARLKKLKDRRSGIDRLGRLSPDEQLSVLLKSLTPEKWQSRARETPYTKYALGAMQAVDADYTRISIETAERVAKQLYDGLIASDILVEHRLQGSVPLDVHIRGVSDVDLLTIDANFRTYSSSGARSLAGQYTLSPKTSIDVLTALRRAAEQILKSKYPKAKVDTSGSKAINVSGGSLPRPVDVVPSHWFDTNDYQLSGREDDRGVAILNDKIPETIDNWPFLHIKRVEDQCRGCIGGIRKAIRLCKNVKADAEEEGTGISLPSFDITAIMYHADKSALIAGYVHELNILVETQRHLDELYQNPSKANSLRVPDGSRFIFDKPEKRAGLLRLSSEIDDLLLEVAKEQNSDLRRPNTLSFATARTALSNIWIPDAA